MHVQKAIRFLVKLYLKGVVFIIINKFKLCKIELGFCNLQFIFSIFFLTFAFMTNDKLDFEFFALDVIIYHVCYSFTGRVRFPGNSD